MTRGLIIAAAVLLAGAASAENVAELHENELRAIDKNNDGFLSREEYDAFADYAFQSMDVNKDNSVGLQEAKPHLDEDQFQDVDRDNDGFISRPEFDTQMNDDFLSADQNQNGQLD